MARHLTFDDVENILKLLDSWDGDLTWDALVRECEVKFGVSTTRQALTRKDKIKEAFSLRKKSLKFSGTSTGKPNSLNIAHHRIERLSNENERLKVENMRLLEQFLTWQYNASKFGVSKDKLNMPLPRASRNSDTS
jgi:hypothetical protein